MSRCARRPALLAAAFSTSGSTGRCGRPCRSPCRCPRARPSARSEGSDRPATSRTTTLSGWSTSERAIEGDEIDHAETTTGPSLLLRGVRGRGLGPEAAGCFRSSATVCVGWAPFEIQCLTRPASRRSSGRRGSYVPRSSCCPRRACCPRRRPTPRRTSRCCRCGSYWTAPVASRSSAVITPFSVLVATAGGRSGRRRRTRSSPARAVDHTALPAASSASTNTPADDEERAHAPKLSGPAKPPPTMPPLAAPRDRLRPRSGLHPSRRSGTCASRGALRGRRRPHHEDVPAGELLGS